jgi:hypothetical protein
MFICELPNEAPLEFIDGAFERFNPKDPVIVLLDPAKVKSIEISFDDFNPHWERMDSIEQMLNNSIFVLPIMVFNGFATRVFDGRHRTLAMWRRSEYVIPFITIREMAPFICRDFGTLSLPSNFDFSRIDYPVYDGDEALHQLQDAQEEAIISTLRSPQFI